MRTWTRFGVFFGGVGMVLGALMPWFEILGPRIRPINVPAEFLVGIADRRQALELVTGVPFYRSAGMALLVGAALAIMGGLFGAKALGWLGGLVGLAVIGLFFLQTVHEIGRIPSQAYGAIVAECGVALALIFGLWPRRGPQPTHRAAEDFTGPGPAPLAGS